MHIHLNTLGGISGDMFISSILDMFPDLKSGLFKDLKGIKAPPTVSFKIIKKKDEGIVGSQFHVLIKSVEGTNKNKHIKYKKIVTLIDESSLSKKIKKTAKEIFEILANAESEIHSVKKSDLSFHEVGDWDSIIDIVASSILISKLNASWSVSSLPIGSGRIKTAHGLMPIPVYAVSKILEGFKFHKDEFNGERVTPTGAAILKFLMRKEKNFDSLGFLYKSGIGFGKNKIIGLCNVLKSIAFNNENHHPGQGKTCKIEFEVDDQNPEDLSIGLKNIAKNNNVLNISQHPVYGKKSRIAILVTIIVLEQALDEVADLCFEETTTIGLRILEIRRITLKRKKSKLNFKDTVFETKISGFNKNIKVESDSLKEIKGLKNRKKIREVAKKVEK